MIKSGFILGDMWGTFGGNSMNIEGELRYLGECFENSRGMLGNSRTCFKHHWASMNDFVNKFVISVNFPLLNNSPNIPCIVPENKATPSVLSNNSSTFKWGSEDWLLFKYWKCKRRIDIMFQY